MNLRQGLVGLFVLTFLISGIGLGLLVLDDQNDLSSRASTGSLSSLRPALSGDRYLESNLVWDGAAFHLPVQVSFDRLLWLPPTETDPIFFHLSSSISVRLVQGSLDLVALGKILGENFVPVKPPLTPQKYLDGWETQTYSYSFFNTEKVVDVWTNSQGLSLLAVMPAGTATPTNNDLARGEVRDLIKGFSVSTSVKGISTPDDTARLAALIRPSVVMILNHYCAQIKFTELGASSLAGKVYPFCLTQSGTGFFVTQDGYLATNGHVVTNPQETALIFGVTNGSLDPLLVDYFHAYFLSQTSLSVDQAMVETKVQEAHQSKETLYQMAGVVNELLKQKTASLEASQNEYYVQLGNTPLQMIDSKIKTSSDVVSATFVAADYQIPDPVLGFSSSDVALLKIDGTGYPALPLGQADEISVGSNILVVGFPGITMGGQNLLLDTSAGAEPTFTKGVISAFKQAKGDKKELIQTDASINHGNSGGPAVSAEGKVVGIATYGLVPEEGSGNYNFLRSVADLQDLMKKNNLSADIGETFPLWQSGLENYWFSYLKPAKNDFEKVASLYQGHPTVSKYLSETNSKIDTPEDKSPRFTRAQRKLYMNLSGGLLAFSIVAIITLTILEFIDSKRRRSATVLPPHATLPPQPTPTF